MSDFLPLFPLQLVVFPGEDLNLHIFEPRYQQLIQECEEGGTPFGIPTFLNNKVMDVGTEMELVNIEKRYPSGEMDIKTKGRGVFKILNYYRKAPEKLYAAGDVEKLEPGREGDFLQNEKILEHLRELFDLLNIQKELPDDPNAFRTYDVGHDAGFSVEQEYALLCIAEEKDRQAYMLAHLEKLLPTVREMKRLQQRAKMNGHFKNIIPPKI